MANTLGSFRGYKDFNTTSLSNSNFNTMIPEQESSQGSAELLTE